MKKFKTLSVVLAALIASTSIVYASPVNAEVVYDSSKGFTYSNYDVNKDNSVNVLDLCILKNFLLGKDAEEDLSLAFRNQEIINRSLAACRSYINQANAEWYAKIVDINIDATTYDGRVDARGAIATITFDRAFDERALGSLCTRLTESMVVDTLNSKCNTLRMVIDDGEVQAVTPYSGTEFSSVVKAEEATIITNELSSYFLGVSAEWYARINSINIRSYYREDDTAVVTVVFDRAFDEEALERMCSHVERDDIADALANKCNTLRVVINRGSVDGVVPVTGKEYTCATTIVNPSEIEYAVTDFLKNSSVEWYAKVNSISIEALSAGSSSSSYRDSGIATIVFDRPLTAEAAKRLLYHVDDPEAEVNYVLENSITTLKMVVEGGTIETVVPVK